MAGVRAGSHRPLQWGAKGSTACAGAQSARASKRGARGRRLQPGGRSGQRYWPGERSVHRAL